MENGHLETIEITRKKRVGRRKPPAKLQDMFVVTVISNPSRYRRRYELYDDFAEMMQSSGVPLITVELGFGQRDFEVTRRGHELHLQVNSSEEFWHKENLINLGIAHGKRVLPHANKVCWVDGDMFPARSPRLWMEETWHELQHFKIVQMWENCLPLDYYDNPLCSPNPSFMANYVKYGTPYPKKQDGYPLNWGSPGGAWAADIQVLDDIGGVPDRAILGAGDWYFAHMLISTLDIPGMDKYSPGYRKYWSDYQTVINEEVGVHDVGYVKGLVLDGFHGHRVNRKYNTRENILIRNQYDPYTDIKEDHQGVYQIRTRLPRQIQMYKEIRQYFRERNEDSIGS